MKRRIVGATLAAAFTVLPLAAGAHAAEVAFLKGQATGEWLAHRLHGTKVVNGKGDVIGSVNDVVLDAAGAATAIVVGTGGVAGIGDKLVAVPFKAVYIGDVAGGSRVVVLDVTKEQLQAAPTYEATDPTTATRLKAKAADWATVAKQKAIEWSNRAAEEAKKLKEQATTPAPEKK